MRAPGACSAPLANHGAPNKPERIADLSVTQWLTTTASVGRRSCGQRPAASDNKTTRSGEAAKRDPATSIRGRGPLCGVRSYAARFVPSRVPPPLVQSASGLRSPAEAGSHEGVNGLSLRGTHGDRETRSAVREADVFDVGIQAEVRTWWQLTKAIVLTALGTAMRRGELRPTVARSQPARSEDRDSRDVCPRPIHDAEEQGIAPRPRARAAHARRPRGAVARNRLPCRRRSRLRPPDEGDAGRSITERYMHAAQVLFPGAAAKSEERMFGQPPAGDVASPPP